MMAQPESDEVLVKRFLPRYNGNPASRAAAWGEWYSEFGEASVMAFIKSQNDTAEADMDIFQEAMTTAFVEVERGRYRPQLNVPFAAYVLDWIWKVRDRIEAYSEVDTLRPLHYEFIQRAAALDVLFPWTPLHKTKLKVMSNWKL